MSESQWTSAGWKIEPFGKGRNAIKSKHTNDLVDALNILGKINITWGDTDEVYYADNGLTLQLSKDGGGSGIGQSKISTYKVKSASAEYLTCREWNGVSEGTFDIKIAKPFDARQPASTTIAGVAYTYTYSAGPDSLNDYRDSDDGTTTEQQVVTPYWYPDCLINAAKTTYSGVSVDGKDLKLIEISSRCWAKVTTE